MQNADTIILTYYKLKKLLTRQEKKKLIMELKITPKYAALLGFLFILLSVQTFRIRRTNKIAVGDGGNLMLQRIIRVHGNFAEYTPIAIILIGFVELYNYSTPLIHALCLAFLIGRISHACGVSKVKEDLRFRIFGMVMTMGVIFISSLLVLIHI